MSAENSGRLPEKAAIIANPVAGGGRGKKHAEQVKWYLEKEDVEAEIIWTNRSGEATGIAQEQMAKGVSLIGGCGGDGTLNEVACGLLETSTALGVLPGGTVNVFARVVGIPLKLDGALDALGRHRADMDRVTVVRCPGAYETPLVAKRLAASGSYDAVICLAAVIRGATYHFELVASGIAKGITQTTLETGVPVIFGVLTTDTIEQAIERAGTKAGNKGADAALAAIEMVNLLRQL